MSLLSPGQLPSEIQVDPLTGWKWASIKADCKTRDERQIYLSGPVYDTKLKIEDRAVCIRYSDKPPEHQAPFVDCRCGFYALKTPVFAYSEAEVLLQVELYGKVIEYERGYRAEYQRILGGWIFCAGDCMCGNTPSRVGVDYDGSLCSACPVCVEKYKHQWSMSDLSDEVGVRLQYGWPEHSGVPTPPPNPNYTGRAP